MNDMLAYSAYDLGEKLRDNTTDNKVYLINEQLDNNTRRKVSFCAVDTENSGWDKGYALDFIVEIPATDNNMSAIYDVLNHTAKQHDIYNKFSLLSEEVHHDDNTGNIVISMELYLDETQPEAHNVLRDVIVSCSSIEQVLVDTAKACVTKVSS